MVVSLVFFYLGKNYFQVSLSLKVSLYVAKITQNTAIELIKEALSIQQKSKNPRILRDPKI